MGLISKSAFLINSSNFPPDIKRDLVEILPQMSLAQINDFINVLEAHFFHSLTMDADRELEEKFKKIQTFMNEVLRTNDMEYSLEYSVKKYIEENNIVDDFFCSR